MQFFTTKITIFVRLFTACQLLGFSGFVYQIAEAKDTAVYEVKAKTVVIKPTSSIGVNPFLGDPTKVSLIRSSVPLVPDTTLPVPQCRSLSYAQANQLLIRNNYDIKLAHSQAEAAASDIISANHAPNPAFSFNVANIRLSQVNSGLGLGKRPYDSIARVDQTFERGQKRFWRTQVATTVAKATTTDISETQRIQQVNLTNAYFAVLQSQERLMLLEEILKTQQKLVDIATTRHKAGDMAKMDYQRLMVEMGRTQNDINAEKSNYANALAMLSTLIGCQVGVGGVQPVVSDTSLPSKFSTPDETPAVIAAKQRLEAAQQNIGLANSGRKADITGGILYEHTPDLHDVVGFGISIPMMIRYRNQGEILRSQAQFKAAGQGVNVAENSIRLEQFGRYSDLQASQQILARYNNDLVPNASKAYDSAKLAWQYGGMSISDFLDSERAYRAVLLEQITAQIAFARSQVLWRLSHATLDEENEQAALSREGDDLVQPNNTPVLIKQATTTN